jgi:hypothetical protein
MRIQCDDSLSILETKKFHSIVMVILIFVNKSKISLDEGDDAHRDQADGVERCS